MPPRKSKSGSTTIGGGLIGGDGFDEAAQTFKHQSPADLRFDESVELMRSFALIDNAEARRKVIALARLLASEHHDEKA